jgi:hypothetical protein
MSGYYHSISPPTSPSPPCKVHYSLNSCYLIFSFSFFHVYDVSGYASRRPRCPLLLYDVILRSTGPPARLSPLWWTCIALALARSSSAGAKRARVALPVTPDRQGSSGHRRPHHHAQGKKARVHEEPVPSPPRHRDDDDYSPSDVDDESTSGTKSDRLNPVLSLACFVWLFLGGLLGLGSWAFGLGS